VTTHKVPQESPTARSQTPSSAPPELHPPAGEANTPHADADTGAGPLSGT